jgi:hypothetical protein
MASLLGREITGVVDKEREQEWIAKYREAMIHAMPGKESRIKRALRAGARFLAVAFRKTQDRQVNTQLDDLAKKNLSETSTPEKQKEKKAG